MTILISDTEARLEGDWTLTGVTSNIDSVALSLHQLEPGSKRSLRVDCGQMQETDINGLQLLNVWIQCARFRGVEPKLINVPKRLQHAMQVLVGNCMQNSYSDAAMVAG